MSGPTGRCQNDLVDAANIVLRSFAPGTELRIDPTGYVVVTWFQWRPAERIERRWMTRGEDFYPVWHKKWGHGGTACTALAQLVRWIKGKPVLPLSTWVYWGGERCALLRQNEGPEVAMNALRNAGYPESVNCVLCGGPLPGSFDWWSLDKVSGPCCNHNNGCRQKVKSDG